MSDKCTRCQKSVYPAEKPIKIRLTGSYHEFGKFVSEIAALPRIVTLHDIEIAPAAKDPTFDQLVLNVTAKTYRYLDDDEVSAAAEDAIFCFVFGSSTSLITYVWNSKLSPTTLFHCLEH